MWLQDFDDSRCDNVLQNRGEVAPEEAAVSASAVITAPTSASAVITAPTSTSAVITAPTSTSAVITTTAPSGATSLTDFARRPPSCCQQDFREAYVIVANGGDGSHQCRARDMIALQNKWDDLLHKCKDSCCQKFWDVFLEIHEFPVNKINKVLQVAKKTFMIPGSAEWARFPTTRRSLLKKINQVDKFWPQILHYMTIDLTRAGLSRPLPSGTKSLSFKFVDPIWAWLVTARNQPPLEMHWKPVAQNQANPVYGGGIQYGECFRQACATCPNGAYPMCVTLHWDGTSGGGISSTPICIGVANTNSSSADTECCVAYMPLTPDQARPEFLKTADATTLKFYIRQECCRAIVRVLESAAVTGVLCRLHNIKNVEVERVLFPRLVAMNFDQPEAQLFFGNV